MRKGEVKRGSKGGFSAPDVVLATQFFTELRGRAAAEGERLLMVAVLEDAAHCFRKHLFAIDRRSQSLFEEAEEWLMEEDTGAAFSFLHICESLDLEPRYIRLALRKWQEQQLEAQRVALPPPLPAAAEWPADLPEPLRKVSGE
jgi:hypothetical protein